MKHLEIDYHYVRNKLVRQELHVRYIHTADQAADIFTKGLYSAQFSLIFAKFMLRERPSAYEGVIGRSSLYHIPQLM